MNGYRRILRVSKFNKRMLPDWFSAALKTSRKCGRYKQMETAVNE